MSEIKVVKLDQQFSNALIVLRRVLAEEPTEVSKMAAIQAFEFTFELSWKYIKASIRMADNRDIEEVKESPNAVIKYAGKKGIIMIDDVLIWLKYLKMRNETVHRYSDVQANKVFDSLKMYLELAEKLLTSLREFNGIDDTN